ncbi:MAG: PPC domain-containing protein [Bryobacterales bacterium]|nr:PPC domain-containing protein [Bryobacterales bacterium]
MKSIVGFSLLAIAAQGWAADCSPQPLEPGTTVSGLLSTDCKGQDSVSPIALVDIAALRPLNVQAYSVDIPENGGVLFLSAAAANFIPAVVVVDGLHQVVTSGTGTTTAPAAAAVSLPRGRATVIVASANGNTGAYTLKTSLESLRDCSGAGLNPGAAISGQLSTSDCRQVDLLVPGTSGRFFDVYKFQITDYTILTAVMSSTVVDSYLILLDAATKKILARDDNSVGNGNAGMSMGVPPGDYLLVATSAGVEAGAYSLRTKVDAPLPCVEDRIALPGSVSATLAASDCGFVDYVPFLTEFSFLKVYKFEVAQRALVTIDLASTRFDAYLGLLHEDKTNIAQDDDSGGGSNARIVVTLDPGVYTILANAYSEGETGAFDLTAAVPDPPSCPIAGLALDASLTPELTSADCRIREMLLEQSAPNPAKAYKLTIEREGTLQVDMAAGVFAPGLVIVDSKNRYPHVNRQQAPGAVRLTTYLAPGDYTVLAYTSDGGLGPFAIQTSFLETPSPSAPE